MEDLNQTAFGLVSGFQPQKTNNCDRIQILAAKQRF
jgi:hypothetical protein